MTDKFNLAEYVDVAERIAAFYDKFPDGRLRSEVTEHTDTRVSVIAWAYRSPDDPLPGTGHSSLDIPGVSPFTRGSELENAETSAWGRAIRAVGIKDKKGKHIASADEVRAKQPGQDEQTVTGGVPPARTPAPAPRTPEEQYLLDRILMTPGMSKQRMTTLANRLGIPHGQHADEQQLSAILELASAEPWPKPDSADFNAMSGYERATARAWWQKREKQETTA